MKNVTFIFSALSLVFVVLTFIGFLVFFNQEYYEAAISVPLFIGLMAFTIMCCAASIYVAVVN